jgi:DNA repair exonuclease SbcCD nuclease subunit
VKIIWRTDVHITDDPPDKRIDDWATTCLNKLEQVGEIARLEKALAVIDGGDLFHRKSPGKNSHNLVQRLLNVHQRYPCRTYANVGNHDVKYGDIRFLGESPLGTLFQSGVIGRLYDHHEVWLEEDGVTVRIVGVPYHGTTYDLDRFTSIKKGSEKFLVIIAHVLASQGGGSMFEQEDIIPYSFLDGLDAELLMFGHWHKNQGITTLPSGKIVVNIGSLSRGSLSQDDIDRTPSCAVITFDEGISVKEVPLNVRSALEVFDLQSKVRQATKEFSMEQFADSLKQTLASGEGVPVEDRIRGLPVEETVREQMLLFLEQAKA